MGWLWLVGSLKLQVSFEEHHFFYRAHLQKRPIVLRSLLIATNPWHPNTYVCIYTNYRSLLQNIGFKEPTNRNKSLTHVQYIQFIHIYNIILNMIYSFVPFAVYIWQIPDVRPIHSYAYIQTYIYITYIEYGIFIHIYNIYWIWYIHSYLSMYTNVYIWQIPDVRWRVMGWLRLAGCLKL